jgi:hypothetical protein
MPDYPPLKASKHRRTNGPATLQNPRIRNRELHPKVRPKRVHMRWLVIQWEIMIRIPSIIAIVGIKSLAATAPFALAGPRRG